MQHVKTYNASFFQIKKTHLVTIFIIWVLFQLFFLTKYGIVTSFEATKYILEANELLTNGQYTSSNFLFYSVEIWLIALCKKLHIGYGFIVTLQMIFNGLSIIYFYRTINHLTDNLKLALGGTLAYLFLFYFHLYNVYLFTESLFFSFSVLYASYLFKLKSISWKNSGIILFFLSLLYFTRPTGIFYIPATLLFLLIKFCNSKNYKLHIPFTVITLIIFYILLNNSMGSGGEFDFLLPYTYEHIICGIPTINTPNKLKISNNENSIKGLSYLIQNHYPLFLKLFTKRLLTFFGVIRPYYSIVHNIYIAFYFYSMYIIVILGLKKGLKYYAPQFSFAFLLIIITAITVMLSCDEWHNRFMLALFPFILLLSTLSIDSLSKPNHKNLKKQIERNC